MIAVVFVLIGISEWKKKYIPQPKQITQTADQSTKTDEIESVKDLIDGEYVFAPIDTTDWRIYQNEAVGFEIKIPKDWKLVNTYVADDIKGSYLYFGKEKTTYSIPEGGESNAAILVLSSDRYNKEAMPLRDFFQKRKSGYGEKLVSLSVDDRKAVMLGEKDVNFFDGDKAWTINFQLYYDRNNNIHTKEHDVFLGMIKTFKFLK